MVTQKVHPTGNFPPWQFAKELAFQVVCRKGREIFRRFI